MRSITPEERRRRRLKELSGWIRKDGTSSLVRLLGRAALLWGSKRETVREYLRDLEGAGLIEVLDEEDEIRWLGSE